MSQLGVAFQRQLDRREFRVRFGHARLRRSPTHYLIPDLAVIPIALDPAAHGEPKALDAFSAPLPLVLEI